MAIIFKAGGTRVEKLPTCTNSPLISIVVVVLNGEAHIETCLRSIIDQRYGNLDVVVFDGGSKDKTVQILEKYDHILSYWQSAPDHGIYDAMNKAIAHTKGQWIYFLGADDYLLPGFSRLALELKDPLTIYYGDMSYSGVVTSRKEYSAYRLAKETICHQAIFYPRKAFDFYIYSKKYTLAADWALNLQLWSDKRFKFKFFPYVVANFEMSGASSLNKDEAFLRDQPRLIRQSLGTWVYLRFMLKRMKRKLLKK